MLRAVGVVLIAVVSPRAGLAQDTAQDPAGHDRFRVLTPERDSVVAEGEFVLSAEPFASPDVPGAVLEQARRRSRWLMFRDSTITTCFGIVSSPRYFEDREFYVGIILNGVSAWSRNVDGQIVIPVYRSPDASAVLVVNLQDSRIVGRVHQRDWNPSPVRPLEWLPFEAERIGQASPGACVRVLTLEGTRTGLSWSRQPPGGTQQRPRVRR